MQIHELDNFSGNLDASVYMAVDNGSDTGKVSINTLLSDTNITIEQLDAALNARIDNIIAGGAAPSAAEVEDARLGADGETYASLGTAIRTQFTNTDGIFRSYAKQALDGDSFLGFVPFRIGTIYNHKFNRSVKYRVVSRAKISFSNYTILTAKAGYLFNLYTGDEDAYEEWTGWKNSWEVAPNVEFNIIIRRATEDASEVLTNTVEFETAVTYMHPFALITKQNKIDIDKIADGFVTPDWGWQRGIITSGDIFSMNNTFRVSTPDPITLEKSTTVYVKPGWDFVVKYVGNPTWGGDSSGTGGQYTVLANTPFRAMIRIHNETQTEVIEDITDFTQAVSIPIAVSGQGPINSIIANNEDVPLLMKQALRPLNMSENQYQTEPKPLVLFHFSDIHGSQTALERLVEFYNEYGTEFDDAICTGDLKAVSTASSMDFWNNVNGAENILISIGNHDATNPDSTEQSEADQYTAMFAPYIANWDVQYTAGKTYYYKDYPASKVRLIVINNMLSSSDRDDQLDWFRLALNGAQIQDYTVIVATHFPNGNLITSGMNCNFTDKDAMRYSGQVLSGYIELAVNDFKEGGGKFACYFGGHVHKDVVKHGDDLPDQLGIFIDAASIYQSMAYSDIHRQSDDRTADLANVFVIDTSSSTVKIIRVGADRNRYLVSRKTIAINYDTLEILSQS